MADIAERLRRMAGSIHGLNQTNWREPDPTPNYLREAADEIERLRAALAIYADPANWDNHEGCQHSVQDEFTDPTPREYTNVCGYQLAQDALSPAEI